MQCQLNWCSWQVYALKICWQLGALATKKQTYTTFITMPLLPTPFCQLEALAPAHSWHGRRPVLERDPLWFPSNLTSPVLSTDREQMPFASRSWSWAGGPKERIRNSCNTGSTDEHDSSGTKGAFMGNVPYTGRASQASPGTSCCSCQICPKEQEEKPRLAQALICLQLSAPMQKPGGAAVSCCLQHLHIEALM